VTKIAAENLCRLFSRNQGLPCVVLRTSRFFPEADDDQGQRETFTDDNLKVNELLFRRVDVEDIVTAHKLAMRKAREISFDRFIISATTPFKRSDAARLGTNAPEVLYDYLPQFKAEYARRNWKMFPTIGRVYDNTRAREILGWKPQYDFNQALKCLESDEDFRSPLTGLIGAKGYHDKVFSDGPYPID
jgi:UDP-glucose 4-epimerase